VVRAAGFECRGMLGDGGREGETYLGLLLEALPRQGENLVLAGGEVVFGRHGCVLLPLMWLLWR
jgi:hypothetical protein